MKKVLLLFIILATPAAGRSSYLGDFGEVFVTPLRDGTAAYRWPGSVTVLSSRELSESGALTADEAVSKLTGISAFNLTGATGRSTVDVRGMGEEAHLRTLILIDGRRSNRTDMGGYNWLEIPVSRIERIEVVRTSNSVMHGSSASGGVINIITRRPSGSRSAMNVEALAGSYGLFGQRLNYQGGTGKFGLTLGAERFTESGYRSRSAVMSEGLSFTLRGRGLPGNTEALVSAVVHESRNEMPGSLTEDELAEDRTQARYTDWSDWMNPVRAENDEDEAAERRREITAEIKIPFSPEASLNLHGGFSRRDEEVNMASYPVFADRSMSSLNISPRFIFITERLIRPVNLRAGADIYSHSLDVSLFSSAERGSPDSEARLEMPVYGGYVHGEVEPAEKLILSAGYRTERARITADLGPGADGGSRRHSGSAFTAGAVYLPVPGVRCYVSGGTHYRYPSTDEQASYQGWSDGFFPDLDPESGLSMEAGLNLNLGSLVSLGISAYRRIIRDIIVWDNDQLRNVNMDQTRRDGLEAFLRFRPAGMISVQAGMSAGSTLFEKGEYKGNKVPLVPRYEYSAAVTAGITPGMKLRADAAYTGERYMGGDFLNTENRLPAYMLVNAGAGLSVFPGAEIICGVKNLFNRRYSVSTWGGWYPAPERSYYVSVRSSF